MARSCALCGQTLPGAGNRLAALEVCDGCWHGDAAERLAGRFDFATRRWKRPGSRHEGTRHFLEVVGAPAGPSGLKMTFSREDLGTRLWKLVYRGEPQAGDPLFDDHVWVSAKQDDPLVQLVLRNPSVQGVVMEVLSDLQGRVELRDGKARVVTASVEGPPPEQTATLHTAALLHVLGRLAAFAAR